MAATIKDVAREACVAISTVSRYINGAPVKPENRIAIEKAIKELDFTPNRSARGLKNLRTYTVGVLAERIDNAYFRALLVGVERHLNEKGYAMILCCHGGSAESAKEYVDFLVEQMVDGIIVSSFPTEVDFLKGAREARIPVVGLEDHIGTGDMDVVRTDATTSSYEMIESLVQKGHRRIAVINDDLSYVSARERLKGFLRVMEDYEIPVCEEWMLSGSQDEAFGYSGMKQIWAGSEHPTAVFAAGYRICLGVMRAVHELGIRIPEDLSIVSFDDQMLSVMVRPNLTCVERPVEQVAKEVCRLLLRRIEKKGTEHSQMVRLKTKVIYRDSVRTLKETDGFTVPI